MFAPKIYKLKKLIFVILILKATAWKGIKILVYDRREDGIPNWWHRSSDFTVSGRLFYRLTLLFFRMIRMIQFGFDI